MYKRMLYSIHIYVKGSLIVYKRKPSCTIGGRILYNRGFPVHIRKPYYTSEDALLYTIGGLIIYNRRLYHIR